MNMNTIIWFLISLLTAATFIVIVFLIATIFGWHTILKHGAWLTISLALPYLAERFLLPKLKKWLNQCQ